MLAPPAVHPGLQSLIQGKVHAVVEHVASELHLGQDPPETKGLLGLRGHGPYGVWAK